MLNKTGSNITIGVNIIQIMLTLSLRRSLSYRKSMDGFLYGSDHRHERVNRKLYVKPITLTSN